MKSRSLTDFRRRDEQFFKSRVRTVLPSYFVDSYPVLVQFLEGYYDFVEQDEADSFSTKIQELYKIRDLTETELDYLNSIFEEIGNGVTADYFNNPRFVGKLLSRFFRVKGSLYSAQGFFRAFYGQEVEIVYPKNDLFIVGESNIGSESLKFIQNYELYQIFSILVKSPIPISKWRTLYKKFVHPAGFYLAGQVLIEGIGNLAIGDMPISIEDVDITPDYVGVAVEEITAFTSITGIYPDGNDSDVFKERISVNNTIDKFQDVSIETLSGMYSSIEDTIAANSPTIDADSDGIAIPVRLDNTLETIDEDRFDWGIPPQLRDSDN